MNFIAFLKESFAKYHIVPVFRLSVMEFSYVWSYFEFMSFLGCTITCNGIINIFDFDSHNLIGQAFNIYIEELGKRS